MLLSATERSLVQQVRTGRYSRRGITLRSLTLPRTVSKPRLPNGIPQGNIPFLNQVLPGDLFCVFLVVFLCHSMLDLAYEIEMKEVQMHTDS